MKKLALLLLIIGITFSQIPNSMTYQGKLTDTDGIGINDSYTIQFRLYNVLTGGTELWSETHSGVLIEKGLFTVELGSITDLDLPFDDEYWLEITVDGDVMTPRQPLSSASYAFRAMIADSVDGGIIDDDWTIVGDDIQLATLGNVGIGTAPAASSRLHVVTNETPGEKAVFGEYSSGGVSGWLGSSLYGAYGEFDSYNYGALGSSGIGILAAGETYAGRFEGDISVTNRFLDSGGDGGTVGQILSSTGAGTDWIDVSGSGSSDLDMILTTDIGDGTSDTVLVTGGKWGLFRAGNIGYGNACSTHVNLGVQCTTGTSGENYKYISVFGGYGNRANGENSLICGGENNTISSNSEGNIIVGGYEHSINNGMLSTISGGMSNIIDGSGVTISGGGINHVSTGDFAVISGGYINSISSGDFSVISGGRFNEIEGTHSVIPGGFNNIISGDYSVAFGNNVTVSSDYTTSFYSEANPGTFNIAGELNAIGTVNVSDLPEDSAPDSVITVVDGQLSKTPIDAINDRDMILTTDIGDGTLDTVLVMEGKWGLFRDGNIGYGNACSTHVNLGVQCTTGIDGSDNKYVAVLSGKGNHASGMRTVICGGVDNSCSGEESYIGGGGDNNILGDYSTVPGGYDNDIEGHFSIISSGSHNDIAGDKGVISGGLANNITGDFNVVSGGAYNEDEGSYCAISGGLHNEITGNYSSIPGGNSNTVNGNYSFAFGRNVNVSSDYRTSFYSDAYPGTFKISGELNVNGIAFVTDLPEDAAPDSVITVVEGQLSKSPIDAINDSDMILTTDIGDGTSDTVLVTGGKWGLFRAGNIGYGNACSTHVNLGVQCTTGTSGSDNYYSAVLSGLGNRASADKSSIGGGENNIINNQFGFIGGGNDNEINSGYSFIGGGSGNSTNRQYATIGGGENNSVNGYASTICGGSGNTTSGTSVSMGNVICGGYDNYAEGTNSAILSGQENIVNGLFSVILGGFQNNVSSRYSLAYGEGINITDDYTTQFYTEADPGFFIFNGKGTFQRYSDVGNGNALLSIRNTCNDEGAYTGIRFKSHDNDDNENYKGGIFFERTSNYGRGDIIFAINNAVATSNVDPTYDRMVIKRDGNVGIDVREPGWLLEVNGNAAKPGGGSWTSSCDRRLKDIHADFDKGIDELLTLQPKYYNYKQDNPLGLPSDQTYIGLIAQDVQAVIPEAVSTNDKSDFLYLNNDAVIMAMLNGIKEQQSQIEELRKENEELKSSNEARDRRIDELSRKLDELLNNN